MTNLTKIALAAGALWATAWALNRPQPAARVCPTCQTSPCSCPPGHG